MVSLWLSFESLSPSSVMTMEARSKKRQVTAHGPRELCTQSEACTSSRAQTMGSASAAVRWHGAQHRAQSQLRVRISRRQSSVPSGAAAGSFCAAVSQRGCGTLRAVPVTAPRPGSSAALGDSFEKQKVFCLRGSGITSTSWGGVQHKIYWMPQTATSVHGWTFPSQHRIMLLSLFLVKANKK